MAKKEPAFLQINASDTRWGASIEAYRLHKAFLKNNFQSHIICGFKESKDQTCSRIIPWKFGYLPNAAMGKIFNYLGLQSFGYPSSFFLKRNSWAKNIADVIILRNIHWWYFSISILPWLAEQKPLIWRLPDMWAITGHCAYSYDCLRWKTGCGDCPYLSEYPELIFDTTRFLWNRKKNIYRILKDKLVFVSPSRWLKGLLAESPLTAQMRCELIPSAVDLDVFSPNKPKEESRRKLGIATGEKVIMFSSFNLNDKRKGAGDFFELIINLPDNIKNNLSLLLTGKHVKSHNLPQGVKIIKLGYVKKDVDLADCYNAADVFLSLSKADNLPNTLIEAVACGLPVISLDSGGCSETFEHGISGYAAKDTKEIAYFLKDLLENEEKRKAFSVESRKFAENNFSMDLQVKRFAFLAEELIKI